MNRLALKVDQWIAIGSDIRLSATDIDAKSVRLLARGRILGGPNDGADFENVHEMAVGSSVHLGPHVAVTLVAVRGEVARIDVFAPAHVPVKQEY